MVGFSLKVSCLIVVVLLTLTSWVNSELIIENEALNSCMSLKNVSTSFGLSSRVLYYHEVNALAASPTGDLASVTANSQIVIWNTAINSIKKTIDKHSNLVTSVAYGYSGKFVSASDDFYAKVFDSTDSYSYKCYVYNQPQIKKVMSLRSSNYFAAAWENAISIFNFNNCYKYLTLQSHSAATLSLAHLKNDHLATGSADKTIKIWGWRDTLKRTLTGHNGSVTALVQLENGELASGSADKTIKLWNSNDGTLINTLNGHTGPISALAVLSNGYLASSSSAENTIRIWDTIRGIQLYTFAGHTASINYLILLPKDEISQLE